MAIDFGEYEIEKTSGGAFHQCALTKGEGEIFCWGDNRQGQLGLGHTISDHQAGAISLLERGPLSFDAADSQ